MTEYENSNLSNSLDIGAVMADFQVSLIANRKRVFQNALDGGNFLVNVQTQVGDYTRVAENSALSALEKIAGLTADNYKSTYNRGVKTIDSEIKMFKTPPKKVSQSNGEQVVASKIAQTLTVLSSALEYAASSATLQMLTIAQQANNNTDNLDNIQLGWLDSGFAAQNGRNIIAEGEFIARVDSHDVYLQALGNTAQDYQQFLVQISGHPTSCPKCAPYQNKILINDVYAQGRPDGKHELMSTAIKNGLFHYNCRHTYTVYIEGQSALNLHKNDTPARKEVAKRYIIEQMQRNNERTIRKYRQRAEGLINEDMRAAAELKVREWQARQRVLAKTAERENIPFYRQYIREQVGGETKPTLPRRNFG